MIHICFALHDKTERYSKFAGTAMCSLFENALVPSRSITVHILHNNTLTNDNRGKFSYLAGRYHQLVKFYNVESLCPKKIEAIKNVLPETFKEQYMIITIYCFLIPYLLSTDIDKVIYLDSNVVINLDINKLWCVKLDDNSLGAVPNLFQNKNKQKSIKLTEKIVKIYDDNIINTEDYFDSGVLLLNLKEMLKEEDKIMSGIEFIAKQLKYENFAQEILNYCFSKKYLRLSVEYNRIVEYACSNKELIGKRIYNYTKEKLWLGLDLEEPFNRLWMDYFAKTPWFDDTIIGNLYDKIQEFSQDRKSKLIKFSATISGKIRAFIVEEDDISWVKEIFSIRDDEDIIVVNKKDDDSINKLIDLINAERDKKIFFTVNPNLVSALEEAGFVHEKDFFSYYKFFLPNLFSTKDIYELILAM